MAALGWFLFSSGGAISVLALLALWILVRPASRLARMSLAAGALFYVVASCHSLTSTLRESIGSDFRPFSRQMVPEGRVAVVILGSGGFTVHGYGDTQLSMLDPWAAGRVLEAVRVQALTDAEWLVVSGGLRDREGLDEPTASMVAKTLVELGVPRERIRAETESRDTHAEAIAIVPLVRSLGADHTILVTSHVHMRRAAGAFLAAGLSVIPAPANDSRQRLSWPMNVLPTEAGLGESSTAAHEIVGIVYYALRGWYRSPS